MGLTSELVGVRRSTAIHEMNPWAPNPRLYFQKADQAATTDKDVLAGNLVWEVALECNTHIQSVCVWSLAMLPCLQRVF